MSLQLKLTILIILLVVILIHNVYLDKSITAFLGDMIRWFVTYSGTVCIHHLRRIFLIFLVWLTSVCFIWLTMRHLERVVQFWYVTSKNVLKKVGNFIVNSIKHLMDKVQTSDTRKRDKEHKIEFKLLGINLRLSSSNEKLIIKVFLLLLSCILIVLYLKS